MKLTDVAPVLRRMRRNQLTLHCEHNNKRHHHCTVWHLTDGSEVFDTVAHELTRHSNIRPGR
jgi:hypothetical protein